MSNWGRSRNGRLLTPKRLKLIRAYYARRPDVQRMPTKPVWHNQLPRLGWYWTAEERAAYRKWRSEFMKEHPRAKKAHRRPTKG